MNRDPGTTPRVPPSEGVTESPFPARDLIFAEIVAERERQEKLVAAGRHLGWCSCADPSTPVEYRLAVLSEEFGEVGKALNELRVGNPAELREELIHVAAVAVAWVEGLDAT